MDKDKNTKSLTEILKGLKPTKDNFKTYIESNDALFHYTTQARAFGEILSKKLFKLSTFDKTNDPKEYKDQSFGTEFHFGNDNDLKLKQEVQPKINSIRKHNLKSLYLCSNKDIKNTNQIGCNKPRMWYDYGENHYGVCLVFSKHKLENYIQSKFKDKNYKCGYVKYTQYSNQIIKAYQIDINRLKQMNDSQSYSKYHVEKYIDFFGFEKNVDYRDESEYRVIIFDYSNNDIYLEIDNFIEGVIAGDRTPTQSFPLIKSICESLNIKCRRISYNKEQMLLLKM